MKNKHTPGPWFVNRDFPKVNILCGDPDDPEVVANAEVNDIMAVGNGIHGTNYEILESNAELMAAAPDLLEALQQVRGLYSEATWLENAPLLHRQIVAVLTKAGAL